MICALWLAVGVLLLSTAAHAGRFIATPFAETLPKGRYSLWQFAVYEQTHAKNWRQLSRLDIGLMENLEFGVLNIRPTDQPTDTWLNVQYQPLKENGWRPGFSIGVWDAFRRGTFFSDEKAGPSPFLSLSKGFQKGQRYLKGGISYGFTRLHGVFGGAELRILAGTGLVAEYSPENLRLPRADAWNVGIYQWLGKSWRTRFSWMGGNPMVDIFFTGKIP